MGACLNAVGMVSTALFLQMALTTKFTLWSKWTKRVFPYSMGKNAFLAIIDFDFTSFSIISLIFGEIRVLVPNFGVFRPFLTPKIG